MKSARSPDIRSSRRYEEAGFCLREVGHDSEIVPVSEADLIQDDDEGRMLFLRREYSLESRLPGEESPMPKAPPVYDARFVLHPEQDATYSHFENAAAHPFQPSAGSFPRVNVWWLAEAALLSYWDPGTAIPIFNAAGLQAEFVNEKNTECYVAWQSHSVMVAFRGTESEEWGDILTDARIAQVPWSTGHVHAGFSAAVHDIWPKLTKLLDKVAQGRTIWFCGHSLGAGLATLAGDRYSATRGVCTFGSPRVGDPVFATAFTIKFVNRCLRYVNHHDVVTHVPPPTLLPWLYRHVDPRRFIDSAGQITSGGPALIHFFSELIGEPITLLEMVDTLHSGVLVHPPVFFLDHMPKAYAIWTWNDYEAHG